LSVWSRSVFCMDRDSSSSTMMKALRFLIVSTVRTGPIRSSSVSSSSPARSTVMATFGPVPTSCRSRR